MLELIDAMNTTELLTTDVTPAISNPPNELRDEIASLWVAHTTAKNTARATNAELHAIRAQLGRQLWEVKRLLASPGRDGQWSGFLRERGIPRATGDRLVTRHLRSLDPSANCVSEPISEPTDEDVQKLFASVWPKLRRTLRSQQSLELFVHLLVGHFESSKVTDQESPVVTPAAAISDLPSLDGSIVAPTLHQQELQICSREPDYGGYCDLP
jgi:hypothetical protein